MEKKVKLCECCYNESKEVVCDSFCIQCEKDICSSCEKKLIIQFQSSDYYDTFQTINIAPLCENCLNKIKNLDENFYQNLVNLYARLFMEEITKQETIKKAKIKTIER